MRKRRASGSISNSSSSPDPDDAPDDDDNNNRGGERGSRGERNVRSSGAAAASSSNSVRSPPSSTSSLLPPLSTASTPTEDSTTNTSTTTTSSSLMAPAPPPLPSSSSSSSSSRRSPFNLNKKLKKSASPPRKGKARGKGGPKLPPSEQVGVGDYDDDDDAAEAGDHVTKKAPSAAKCEPKLECPICYDTINHDRKIMCSNNHTFCTSCMRKIIRDVAGRDASSIPHVKGCNGDPLTCKCTGFGFDCPVCRTSCVMEPQHVRAVIKGYWQNRPERLPAMQTRRKKDRRKEWEGQLTAKGYTKTCVSCSRIYGTKTPSVDDDGNLLGLCCSNGHSLCIPCSRELGDVTKCTSATCKGTKCKTFGMGYSCPECEARHIIGRTHMAVLLRGGWPGKPAYVD
mmetsp:Transcript_19555/g.40527  ORF Transcript_19555/g.40527 Transcript_19555/m.40527 type:complete len:398 (-) Transcript_19555:37-1230(-)